MKVSFLLGTVYGMGGIVRTTVSLANHLAGRGHDVELISAFRDDDQPHFTIDPRVTMRDLVDRRDTSPRRAVRRRLAEPSRVVPEDDVLFEQVNAQTDHQLQRVLKRLRSDVLIATRPSLNIAAAMFTAKQVVRVGQEHTTLEYHKAGVLPHLRQWYPKLDAFVTLSEEEKTAYERLLSAAPVDIHTIPNGIPEIAYPRSRQENRVVVAAGRLAKVKGYDRLITAFAQVVREHPDWQLRVYGDGAQGNKLRRLAGELGIYNNVIFMGKTADMEGAFAKASIYAMSSHSEGFPMTIVEALACGVPTVSFDCPRGPRQIIDHEHNGLLIPDGDVDALARGISGLIEDDTRRRRLAANALASAEAYGIGHIGARWEALLTELIAAKRRSGG
jgi:glycosyltransferase involved in cell wall biosynthesis